MSKKWNRRCHIVTPDRGTPVTVLTKYLVDMHSHGLKDIIGTELQYVINVGREEYFQERCELFNSIAELVLNGKLKIEDGLVFSVDGWEDCKFKLHKAKDCYNEDIYRVIEPDMSGRFPEDKNCAEPFRYQYMDLDWLKG